MTVGVGVGARVRALVERIASEEGSTRPLALVRIGVALILWSRFGSDFALFAHRLSWLWTLVGLSFFLSTSAMLVGLRARLAGAWVALTLGVIIGHFGVVGGNKDYLHHHVTLLLIVAILLALAPCGRSYSVDRWLAVRAAERAGTEPPPERGPLWAQWLVCLQLSAVYFWGAVDKTNPGYLSGERMEHYILYYNLGSSYPRSPLFAPLVQASALFSVAFEYVLAFGLWRRRWRRWLVPAGVVFHGVIYFTMPVITFTVTTWLLYVLYFPPDEVHRAIDRVS